MNLCYTWCNPTLWPYQSNTGLYCELTTVLQTKLFTCTKLPRTFMRRLNNITLVCLVCFAGHFTIWKNIIYLYRSNTWLKRMTLCAIFKCAAHQVSLSNLYLLKYNLSSLVYIDFSTWTLQTLKAEVLSIRRVSPLIQ